MKNNLNIKDKRNFLSSFLMMVFLLTIGCSTTQCQNPASTTSTNTPKQTTTMKWNKLTPAEERVILHKGTDMPYTCEDT